MTSTRAIGLVAGFATVGALADFVVSTVGGYYSLRIIRSAVAEQGLVPPDIGTLAMASVWSSYHGLLVGAIAGVMIVAILTWQHVRLATR